MSVRITKQFIVDYIVQQELDWVLEGETERFTNLLREGFAPKFRGYNKQSRLSMVRIAKEMDLWDDIVAAAEQEAEDRAEEAKVLKDVGRSGKYKF